MSSVGRYMANETTGYRCGIAAWRLLYRPRRKYGRESRNDKAVKPRSASDSAILFRLNDVVGTVSAECFVLVPSLLVRSR